MQNTSPEFAIPRESIVVEYVAGRLSLQASKQFEAKLVNDVELQAAVKFERELSCKIQLLNLQDTHEIDGGEFDALIGRIDEFEMFENDAVIEQNSPIKNTSISVTNLASKIFLNKGRQKFAVVASLALATFFSVLLTSSFQTQLLAPEYQGLSTQEPFEMNLPSLATEKRIAKLIISTSLDTNSVTQLLTEYGLQLLSQVPEQSAVIVLSQHPIEAHMLDALRDDERTVNATLISLNGVND